MKMLSVASYSHKNNDVITKTNGSIFNKGLKLSELIVWSCKWLSLVDIWHSYEYIGYQGQQS